MTSGPGKKHPPWIAISRHLAMMQLSSVTGRRTFARKGLTLLIWYTLRRTRRRKRRYRGVFSRTTLKLSPDQVTVSGELAVALMALGSLSPLRETDSVYAPAARPFAIRTLTR